MTVRSVRALGLALFSLAAGCGGSEKPAASADAADSSSESAETETDSTESESSEARSDEAPAAKVSCDDGTCSPCGDALCPSGWYCDESAPGGAACGWLPECAKKPA